MPKRLYLVTGGAGFIGSHIVERLLREGHAVRVLDDFSNGKPENLRAMSGDIDLISGNIRDRDVVARAVTGAYVVFHQADPLTTHESNVTGTLNILLAARDLGVRRVVFASSSSVYGETPVLPKHEDMKPEPRSPYALSKLSAEQYCGVFHHIYGSETVALRYFNIFGPRQDPESQYAAVIPKFVTAILGGGRPVIFGDGRQSRDFTYVDNVVEANLLASEAEGASGRFFNIACGGRYTLLQLLDRINAILGAEIEPIHEPPRRGDVRDSQASIEAAQTALGYRVSVDFDEGLRRTVEWYRSNKA